MASTLAEAAGSGAEDVRQGPEEEEGSGAGLHSWPRRRAILWHVALSPAPPRPLQTGSRPCRLLCLFSFLPSFSKTQTAWGPGRWESCPRPHTRLGADGQGGVSCARAVDQFHTALLISVLSSLSLQIISLDPTCLSGLTLWQGHGEDPHRLLLAFPDSRPPAPPALSSARWVTSSLQAVVPQPRDGAHAIPRPRTPSASPVSWVSSKLPSTAEGSPSLQLSSAIPTEVASRPPRPPAPPFALTSGVKACHLLPPSTCCSPRSRHLDPWARPVPENCPRNTK